MQHNQVFWQSIESAVKLELGSHINPETCYASAEVRNKSGNWQEALVMLHVGITNRRTKQNMQNLEKMMALMIEICAQNLTTNYLKDDIGYFRNLCQHNHLQLLEKMLKFLRTESEKVFLKLEEEFGKDELQKFFSEESDQVTLVNELEASADDLILMAYTNLDVIEEKSKVMPRINFFIDTFKNILDTLR